MMHTTVVYVLVSFVCVFCLGGVVFGYASLAPTLYDLKVYESVCTAAERESCTSNGCCGAQRERMAAMASAALFCADAVMVIYGEVKDRLGAKWCFGLGASLSLSGFCVLSRAAAVRVDSWFFAALCLLGLGGPGVTMGCLSFGERNGNEPVIAAATAAAWDASALVFLLFQLMNLADASLLWAGFGALLCAATIRLLDDLDTATGGKQHLCGGKSLYDPDDDIAYQAVDGSLEEDDIRLDGFTSSSARGTTVVERGSQQATDEYTALASPQSQASSSAASTTMLSRCVVPCDEDIELNDDEDDDLPNDSDIYGSSVWYHVVRRRDTVLLLAFMALYNLKSSFYIETIADDIELTLNSERTARRVSRTFDVAFPVGGFVASFIVAVILQRFERHSFITFGVVALLTNLFCLLHLIPTAATQYAAAIIFGPARTCQWATYFHFITSSGGRYPPAVKGRLLGYGNLVIALIGDAAVPALTAFVEGGWFLFSYYRHDDVDDDNSPEFQSSHRGPRYLAVNVALATAVAFSSFLFLAHLRHDSSSRFAFHSRKKKCCLDSSV